ncbi:MAG: SDR family oxidoreductase [Aureispira sp.]|nr:SDR family oxidoreductase [Aureispira sp.]
MTTTTILLAGATGYLGSHIAKELLAQNYKSTVLVRNPKKFEQLGLHTTKIITAQITKPQDLEGCCEGIDIVISTVGITKQRDGVSYIDVDYQANLNLLEEAKKSAVKKFIYVSALNGDKLRNLQIFAAKEKFVDQLKSSGLDYCVVRPNGFFSDLSEVYNMAKKGRVYLFGDGQLKANPIHGEDLAKVCIEAIEQQQQEINIGGPEILTQTEIAQIAFKVLGKTPKITYIPNWARKLLLKLSKVFLSAQRFGPIEFFMTVLSMEMIAPTTGEHTLEQHFEELNKLP